MIKWIKNLIEKIKESLNPLANGSVYIEEDAVAKYEEREAQRNNEDKDEEPYDGMEP